MPEENRPDIDAYLRRIGLAGPVPPTLETLDAVLARHICAIPFENVSVLLGEPVPLDLPSVERKLVRGRRGGYCFEQNGYLLSVLREMGFRARPLSARVRFQQPREFTPPRTHLFVEVDIGGAAWMADVGVGGLSPGKALRMGTGDEQDTPWETRRLAREGGLWFHQVRFGGEWADVTDFTGEEMPTIDREVANWWTSASPQSRFRQGLSVALAAPGRTRYTLQNREFTVRRAGAVAERRLLGSHAEMVRVLRDTFGIDAPPGAEIRAPGIDWSAQP